MPTEIEAKVQVEDHESVRARLRALGARHARDVLETNTFFDTPDRTLLAGDQGLRLRRARDAALGMDSIVVTFKGPAANGQLKRREEIEFSVSDAHAARHLFERLGYHAEVTFEKRRQSWELDGCHVELDELPRLGKFVEVEGPDEPAIMRVLELLGLTTRPLVRRTYIAMVAGLLDGQSAGERSLRFE